MSSPPSVEVINFGDELLVGIRENAHLKYLGGQLARYGLPVQRAQIITDDPPEVACAFREAWRRSEVIITTGGLGPTADDLTRETIANALGAELVFDAKIEEAIVKYFAVLGREMAAHHKKQCYRFRDSVVLRNERGTAPGMVYQAEGKTLIMLPGPTHELHPMFEQQVLPMLQSRGLLAAEPVYTNVRTCGVGESTVEEHLQPLIADYKDLTVAYCVHYGIVDVRFSSRTGKLGSEQLKEVAQEARRTMGENFVCYGECSLAQVVFRELRALDRTLVVAESCTGGLLSDAFTNIPGVSKNFVGGVICYTNDVKVSQLKVPEILLEQHGAVSPECAVAMASGAAERLCADYGLSVTGFAGPDGGNKENPVGTIHIGYHSPVGVWCKTVRYTGGRLDVKARAVIAALDWMRRKLRKYKIEEFLSPGSRD